MPYHEMFVDDSMHRHLLIPEFGGDIDPGDEGPTGEDHLVGGGQDPVEGHGVLHGTVVQGRPPPGQANFQRIAPNDRENHGHLFVGMQIRELLQMIEMMRYKHVYRPIKLENCCK